MLDEDDVWSGTCIDFDVLPAAYRVGTRAGVRSSPKPGGRGYLGSSSDCGNTDDTPQPVENGSSVDSNVGKPDEQNHKGPNTWSHVKKTNWDSLEGAEPELCILYFQRGLNYRALKNRLKSADQEWIADFLDRDGLAVIFNALSALGQRGISSISGALDQLNCLAAVKEVMNRPVGLEYMVEGAGREQMGSLMTGELHVHVMLRAVTGLLASRWIIYMVYPCNVTELN